MIPTSVVRRSPPGRNTRRSLLEPEGLADRARHGHLALRAESRGDFHGATPYNINDVRARPSHDRPPGRVAVVALASTLGWTVGAAVIGTIERNPLAELFLGNGATGLVIRAITDVALLSQLPNRRDR